MRARFGCRRCPRGVARRSPGTARVGNLRPSPTATMRIGAAPPRYRCGVSRRSAEPTRDSSARRIRPVNPRGSVRDHATAHYARFRSSAANRRKVRTHRGRKGVRRTGRRSRRLRHRGRIRWNHRYSPSPNSSENQQRQQSSPKNRILHRPRNPSRWTPPIHTCGHDDEACPAGDRCTATTRDSAQTREIRQWAAKKGYEIGDRGRIPASIAEAYDTAHRPAAH